MKKSEYIFKNIWLDANFQNDSYYKIHYDFKLKDLSNADVAFFCSDSCIALGNYQDELNDFDIENQHKYLHKFGFIGTEIETKFWFYFNENILVLNDLKYIYPIDEFIYSSEQLFNHISNSSK